jgi:hypothetical protein
MIIYKNQDHNNNRSGLTAIEMTIAMTLLFITLLAVSGVLSDSQNGWNSMYGRTFSEVMTGGHMAKRSFDSIIRKSSTKELTIDTAGTWVEVHYYNTDASTFLDQYAKFYRSGSTLRLEWGWLNPSNTSNPRGVSGTETICSNVANCVFKQSGKSVHMMLTLNNGSEKLLIGSSAILHNN